MIRFVPTIALIISFFLANLASADEPINFTRDIQPILAGNCFVCHGPDEGTREGGFRLDTFEGAIAEADSGEHTIVPGSPEKSELLNRVNSSDDDYRMPPSGSSKPLSDRQKELLTRWIKQGAKYEKHWSFKKPEKKKLPVVKNAVWAKNGIDLFILDRLEKEKITPSPSAEKYILCRRVYLDLTGLPPTIEQADQFVNDPDPDAFRKLVDRLLDSPRYGERWARIWLDLARYADSQGYAQDSPRTIYRYRDWVINSINENKTFDEFTIEQLAGDLLPNPTTEQLIATAFHRNTMTNSEGGTDDEEFRTAAVVDRTNTTMQVWMGLTVGCAQCHTHKYDPITQHEYFKLFAILNQTQDADRGNEAPVLEEFLPSQLVQKSKLEQEIANLKIKIAKADKKPKSIPLPKGELKTRFVRVQAIGKAFLHLAEVEVFSGETNVAPKGKASQSSTDFGGPAKYGNDGNTDGDFTKKSVTHTASEMDPWWEVDLGSSQSVGEIKIWNRNDVESVRDRLNHWRVILFDENRNPIWISSTKEVPKPSKAFSIPKTAEEFDKPTQAELLAFLKTGNFGPQTDERKLKSLTDRLAKIKPAIRTPIFRELAPNRKRETFVHVRGNFRIKGDKVDPGFAKALHQPSGLKSAPNRLDLANWLVDRENALTARVIVNRYWEHLFGSGIVQTSEDFGTQGELPSHPELLDYLAVEFQNHQWDTKWLIREMVTSATYRQTSKVTTDLLEIDPYNRLLARGPRFRLPAEMIRDQALEISGLLSTKMMGPSVRPVRPKLGLRAAFGGSTDWEASPGEDRYRRGLYTTWRRTSPYPSMSTFDAPSREFCTIRRSRTNTPLQALVTMNDPVFVEAAQVLAAQTIEKSTDQTARITFAFRKTLTRPPTQEEVEVLSGAYSTVYQKYLGDMKAAKEMTANSKLGMKIGKSKDSKADKDKAVAEFAAWTVMGNVLMNLDEALARP